MKTVPSAVICGVTSSFSTASMNVIEIVLLIVVCTGIFVPCLTTAFSLFWVTTRGFESSLPTPRDSAAVMKKSTAKFGERCEKPMPLVGTPAPRLTASGKPLDDAPDEEEPVLVTLTTGPLGIDPPVDTPLLPPCPPKNRLRPWVVDPEKPSSVPM